MKKYRLKKDLPAVRAGEVFVRKINETMQTDMLYRVDSEGVFLPPSIEVNDIHNFDEWFEEVKEFSAYTPTDGERYKFLNVYGEVGNLGHLKDYQSDQFRLSIGNAYPLDTPDEVIIKEQRLIPQAMHRLRMAAKKAWFEFNGSEGPDWKSGVQSKFSIVYGSSGARPCQSFLMRDLGQVSFPTEKSCQAYIDSNKDDLKLLFGVE